MKEVKNVKENDNYKKKKEWRIATHIVLHVSVDHFIKLLFTFIVPSKPLFDSRMPS